MVSSHYRSPLNYSDQHLDNARSGLTTFYTALRGLNLVQAPVTDDEYSKRFYAAMNDDFNTPEAIAVLFELARECNRLRDGDAAEAAQIGAQLKQLGNYLGLLQREPDTFLQGETDDGGFGSEVIEELIRQRTEARANKNWAESDRIRDELAVQGVVLEDGAGGTTWRRE